MTNKYRLTITNLNTGKVEVDGYITAIIGVLLDEHKKVQPIRILSENVAETMVTIDGVLREVDCIVTDIERTASKEVVEALHKFFREDMK